MTDKTDRNIAEGNEPDDLKRDPVEDEFEQSNTVPDPEDELSERDDTQYTEVEKD